MNGQFDSRVEARLRTFLESVVGYRLRCENSAEYAALLWGHFYGQLRMEQHRGDLVRRQVKEDMADISTGSAFHMAIIARAQLASLMPDIAIDAMRPGDIDNPKRQIQSQRDLVIMLSWSSTTAEMVQLAQRLLSDDILMIGITEKRLLPAFYRHRFLLPVGP